MPAKCEQKEITLLLQVIKSCHPYHGVASYISLAALSSCYAFEIAASLISLLRLFREKARLLRLFACKRAHDGSTSLPPFRGN